MSWLPVKNFIICAMIIVRLIMQENIPNETIIKVELKKLPEAFKEDLLK